MGDRPPPGRGAETCRSSAWVEKLLFGCLRLLARPGAGAGRGGWGGWGGWGVWGGWGGGGGGGGWGEWGEWGEWGGWRLWGMRISWGKAGLLGGEDRAARVGMGDAIFGDGALGSREMLALGGCLRRRSGGRDG